MFRALLRFQPQIRSSPIYSFTTIPILATKLKLFSQNSSQTIENFMSDKDKMSNSDFLAYIDFFSSAKTNNPALWDSVHFHLQTNFDQLSLQELALVSLSIGKIKRYDEKFWRSMENKLLENLYFDEDSYYLLGMYLEGFIRRGFRISDLTCMRLIDYLDVAIDEIPGNDLANITHAMAQMKKEEVLGCVERYDYLINKLLKKCIIELKYLDFQGLGHLANAAKLCKRMNEDLEKEILKNLILQEETMNSQGASLVFQAFEKNSTVLQGDVGKLIIYSALKNGMNATGKAFVESCLNLIDNEVNDQSISQILIENIKRQINIFDGPDSIKIAICCKKLNLKEEPIIKQLRENVFAYLDEITEEELKIVREVFADLIPNDQEFWNKCVGRVWKTE